MRRPLFVSAFIFGLNIDLITRQQELVDVTPPHGVDALSVLSVGHWVSRPVLIVDHPGSQRNPVLAGNVRPEANAVQSRDPPVRHSQIDRTPRNVVQLTDIWNNNNNKTWNKRRKIKKRFFFS